MVIGIGIDLCDVRRIDAALQRHGERFAQKILAPGELVTFRARSARWPERGPRYLATRFAAKEAFSKAVGLGMRMPMTWRSCEITKAASGAPSFQLHGELKTWFEAKSWQAHLTLTDEGDMAAAFVVVEARG
jgi:holo-[acyl-carrier protein] synthase